MEMIFQGGGLVVVNVPKARTSRIMAGDTRWERFT
jgi:hypothetical protein